MFKVNDYWNPRQTQLRQAFKEKSADKAIGLTIELHSCVHSSEVYKKEQSSYFDEIWEGLNEEAFRTLPTLKDVTIAWDIWHITRIEDITSNLLIADGAQILNDEWLKRLNTQVKDTGNAMTKEEIAAFSKKLNMDELRNYRIAVGLRTKQVIEKLDNKDFKRKFSSAQVQRILSEGAVLDHKDSSYLLDFWGKKTVEGIILMPITRHQIVHLNDCSKLKTRFKKMQVL